jgi:hypothetical protein
MQCNTFLPTSENNVYALQTPAHGSTAMEKRQLKLISLNSHNQVNIKKVIKEEKLTTQYISSASGGGVATLLHGKGKCWHSFFQAKTLEGSRATTYSIPLSPSDPGRLSPFSSSCAAQIWSPDICPPPL